MPTAKKRNKKTDECHDRSVAKRVVGLMLDNDIALSVPAEAVERMINRVMGAMTLARCDERECAQVQATD